MSRWLALGAFAACLHAQSLDIYPEFRRVDPFGGVVPVDRGWVQREVLSPAVVRGGFASFHIVVTVPPPDTYLLYVAPNPVSACRVSLYREHFTKTAHGWIPDQLTEVTQLPDFGAMPDPDDHIEGQNTRVYLLDLWIPPNADVARFRLEVQLKLADWTVRPMELRVLPGVFPARKASTDAVVPELPPVEESADSPALQVVAAYTANSPIRADASPGTVRAIIRRNAIQDMALAHGFDPRIGGPAEMQRRAFDLLLANLRLVPRVFGAEWYLRLRDYLFNQTKP